MKKAILLFVVAMLALSFVKAQEVVFPLTSNPVIKEYLKRNAFGLNNNVNRNPETTDPKLKTNAFDTIPFIDDFSKPLGIYPDPAHWIDSGAFINSTFCDNPITVGVATLDGIDKEGNAYKPNSSSTSPIICDYLTSKPINLSGLTAGDSVFFSFYYQPQGLGDEPESTDSLILQFFGKDTLWQNVWSHEGTPDAPFARVNINISDSNYLDSAFQFRFMNLATPNGNRDHWNIDYVFLGKNRSGNDSLDGLTDLAFINQPTSLLQEYQSMPWTHYANYSNTLSLMKTSFTDSIRNIWYLGGAFTDSSNIFGSSGSIYSATSGSLITSKNTITAYTFNLSTFVYPPGPNDSAEFLVKDYFPAVGTPLYTRDNDTIRYTQKFYDYYAYDDGTAEAAYGISVAFAKMAYRFDLKMADTLRGIQIYFNPWGKNVHNNLIQICLWDAIDVAANTEHVQHKQINNYVKNIDSINGFATYVFDTSQFVSGRIYVGLIQSTADLLGVGVDVNTNSSNNMFINYNNHWYQSGIPASWMIRPLFGKDLRVGIDEQSAGNNNFEIYPNPTRSQFTVYGLQFTVGATLDIFNVLGEKVWSQQLQTSNSKSQTSVDVSNLPNGIYFVKLSDSKNRAGGVKRLIVQH